MAIDTRKQSTEFVQRLPPSLMTRNARYTAIATKTRELCSYIADQPAGEFNKYKQCVEEFLSCIHSGKVSLALENLKILNGSTVSTHTSGKCLALLVCMKERLEQLAKKIDAYRD